MRARTADHSVWFQAGLARLATHQGCCAEPTLCILHCNWWHHAVPISCPRCPSPNLLAGPRQAPLANCRHLLACPPLSHHRGLRLHHRLAPELTAPWRAPPLLSLRSRWLAYAALSSARHWKPPTPAVSTYWSTPRLIENHVDSLPIDNRRFASCTAMHSLGFCTARLHRRN